MINEEPAEDSRVAPEGRRKTAENPQRRKERNWVRERWQEGEEERKANEAIRKTVTGSANMNMGDRCKQKLQ